MRVTALRGLDLQTFKCVLSVAVASEVFLVLFAVLEISGTMLRQHFRKTHKQNSLLRHGDASGKMLGLNFLFTSLFPQR